MKDYTKDDSKLNTGQNLLLIYMFMDKIDKVYNTGDVSFKNSPICEVLNTFNRYAYDRSYYNKRKIPCITSKLKDDLINLFEAKHKENILSLKELNYIKERLDSKFIFNADNRFTHINYIRTLFFSYLNARPNLINTTIVKQNIGKIQESCNIYKKNFLLVNTLNKVNKFANNYLAVVNKRTKAEKTSLNIIDPNSLFYKNLQTRSENMEKTA